jgi:hypothetical protein
MTKLAKFLLITLSVIILEGLYFEYVISRELIPDLISGILTIGAIFLFIGYCYYTYKLLIDVLKINKQ